jgi:predicted alpha-1,6-mannanase (GH76 family)
MVRETGLEPARNRAEFRLVAAALRGESASLHQLVGAIPMSCRIVSMIPFCVLALMTAGGCGGGSIIVPTAPGNTVTSAQSYLEQAASGIQTLQHWYVQSGGLYEEPAGWWNAANSITVLANFEQLTGSAEYNSEMANTFTAAQASHANFEDTFYDDDGWWALAWIDAYDVTGNTGYLTMAETIFTTMTGAWDSTCGGGVWWSTARGYKNAIPNELFLMIAAKLANRTTGSVSAGYLKWAQQEWTWFKGSGMINAQNLVNDGLTSTNPSACTNNGGTTWTYNQGVILGGLVELYKADKDPTLLSAAGGIAAAAMAKLSTNGILTEAGKVTGGDGPQFKGVFMRNLMTLYAAAPNAQYKTFADANADSIVAHDQGPNCEFGLLWQGPFDSGDATRQTSALDAIIAAAAMQ